MTPAAQVPRVLASLAATVEPLGHERWSFTFGKDTPVAARARVEDGWLVLVAERPHALPIRGAWATLEWNRTLAGGARFALAPREPRLLIRADIALDPAVDLERRIHEACVGFRTAIRHDEPLPSTTQPEVVDASPELSCQCRDTTWPVEPRGPRELSVDLGVPGAFHQAVVNARADGTVAAVVPLLESAEEAPPSEVGRRAVALLLTRLGGIVRLARAAAAPADPASLRFEVVQTRPTTIELAHTFAALAVACRLAAAEATALYHDEAVARLYLQQHRNDAVVPRAA